ncbi:hypothetical protein LWI28_027723 [Acer negundo]|uniref:Uncharacterized protein n=1 Tax=Acer negundo TaxID=4023 RepID=A0AAD5IGN8_ACENE|nr:hypothetical protein LWI28_027723 [Acer negundo]
MVALQTRWPQTLSTTQDVPPSKLQSGLPLARAVPGPVCPWVVVAFRVMSASWNKCRFPVYKSDGDEGIQNWQKRAPKMERGVSYEEPHRFAKRQENFLLQKLLRRT